MSIKRMKHPLHGFMHVYNGGEESHVRALGWIEESERFPGEEVLQESAEQVAQEVEQAAPERKKPGRKPKVQ